MCTVFCHRAMPLRYDWLCRITSRKSITCVCKSAYVYEREAGGWEGERKRERTRDGILFLYGDRGGCPVFRVTWLNGIALAHSCPLRRDGRLASRIFLPPPIFFPASPLYARPSHNQSRLASCFACKRSQKNGLFPFLFLFVFFFWPRQQTERGLVS